MARQAVRTMKAPPAPEETLKSGAVMSRVSPSPSGHPGPVRDSGKARIAFNPACQSRNSAQSTPLRLVCWLLAVPDQWQTPIPTCVTSQVTSLVPLVTAGGPATQLVAVNL